MAARAVLVHVYKIKQKIITTAEKEPEKAFYLLLRFQVKLKHLNLDIEVFLPP